MIIREYWRLTKPTIVYLVVFTGLATSIAEGVFFRDIRNSLLVLFFIGLAAASANAFNQIIDKDIDSQMERTRKRRPLPRETLSNLEAIIFASLGSIISTIGLWALFGRLSALISLGTIAFYILIYTLWLKRRHPYNIVIGGVAGSTAPLIISAAMNASISWQAWLGFWVIFTWTPPHFWALALAIKDEYAKVGIPMLPNVKGNKRTYIEIVAYTIVLLPLSVIPQWIFGANSVTLILSCLLWVWYFYETCLRLKSPVRKNLMRLFYVSIFYLFLYFVVLGLDGFLRYSQDRL